MASSRKGGPDPGGLSAACLARHLPPDARLAVAYSGGLDSTVLLHALAALAREGRGFRLSALHVHHGLSPRADAWADHCQATCDALGVPLRIERVQVNRVGDGLEAAARKARYQVFARVGVDAVALAHHQDDQAETVLLQLERGGTLRGMAAMPEARELVPGVLLLRPLLALDRAHLLAYAKSRGLAWVEDESNQDQGLTRNLLRHTLMPSLEQALPGLTRGLARAAGQFAEAAGLLDCLARDDAREVILDGRLSLARWRALSEPRARNLLRWCIEQAGGRLRLGALTEADRQLREAASHTGVRTDFGSVSLVRGGGWVELVPRHVLAPPPVLDLSWQGESRLDLGPAGSLHFRPESGTGPDRGPRVALDGGPVRVRHRRGGDRVGISSARLRRPLKDVLRERAVPAWQRPWLPVLEVEGRIAWVGGVGPTAEGLALPGAPGWVISWAPPW
ncbi:MAG: tRNA lysidine(34) synthetase TilS [Pseudomonadota bacterium]